MNKPFLFLMLLVASVATSNSLLAESPTSQPGQKSTIGHRAQQEKDPKEAESVRPGINDNFLNPDLNLEQWLSRFEIESREVYKARDEVIAKMGIRSGSQIADVGAGTGFFSRLFADRVGREGWVFSVDISPRFIEHIRKKCQDDRVTNIAPVLCTDRSICLPANSVDVVFICDTYHHFEYPDQTLASIYKSLRKGGDLIIIDFDRIPGESREFLLNHIRAGKEVFRKEIESAGFLLKAEEKIDGFQENYFLRFEKK
ncbi:MAG: methyltransferase domain-containing protein [Pirellulaceae bacterium]|jgi:ubiquinone/menaquinone biosynthesis C-methylase UbiE|nr:methyltransferase domain-containing protein [Pirellulaceae bacterium]